MTHNMDQIMCRHLTDKIKNSTRIAFIWKVNFRYYYFFSLRTLGNGSMFPIFVFIPLYV